jgi:acetoin utilization protein AcuB
MKTAALMTRHVVVVMPSVTVGAAADLMRRLRVRHLPVLESGRLAGVLSDRDLLRYDAASSCGEAMTPSPITCSPAAPISRIARLMLDNKIDSVPVVGEAGDLVGLVTSADLLSLLLDRANADVLPFDFKVRLATSDAEALALAA